MGKSSLLPILRSYLGTFHAASSRSVRIADVAVHIGIPAAIGIALYVFNPSFFLCLEKTSGNAIMAVSIVSALLCALAVMIFQLRMQMMEMVDPRPTARETTLVDELFSITLWSVISGFATVLLLVFAEPVTAASSEIGNAFWATGVAFGFNFILSARMCLKRLFVAYTVVSKKWAKSIS